MSVPIFDRAETRDLPRIHERQELEEARNALDHRDGPFGLEMREWTSADGVVRAALRCTSHPVKEARNQVTGFEYADAELMSPLLDWFDAARCSCHVRVSAADLAPKPAAAMYALGFLPMETEIWLAARAKDVAGATPKVDVVLADSEERRAQWADVAMEGWGLPASAGPVTRASLAPYPGPSHWRWLIARVDREPVGEALLVLYPDEDIAYFADAAVIPAGRGKGVQRALIAARAKIARKAGVGRVFAGATYGSASHRNMAATGMVPAECSILWTRPPAKSSY